MLSNRLQVDDTPDYTDSDTNPNTTASSVMGDALPDNRKRRSEVNQLRRSIFGKKHDRLGESKVRDERLGTLHGCRRSLSTALFC